MTCLAGKGGVRHVAGLAVRVNRIEIQGIDSDRSVPYHQHRLGLTSNPRSTHRESAAALQGSAPSPHRRSDAPTPPVVGPPTSGSDTGKPYYYYYYYYYCYYYYYYYYY